MIDDSVVLLFYTTLFIAILIVAGFIADKIPDKAITNLIKRGRRKFHG
jgi:Flp pilus assembly protein protease CpaA